MHTRKPSPETPEESGSRADLFVVGAFLVTFVVVVLYGIVRFIVRLWS
jgi:predicted benzoate:H+ symporter BenE